MTRLTKISALAIAAIATLNAGQIQIGAGTAGADGLTQAYVATPTAGSCRGAGLWDNGPLENGCSTNTNALNNRPYQANLFASALPAAVVPATPLTDAGNGNVQFARMNDGINNFWFTGNPTTSSNTITVSVGIYGVDKVWTMLNDYWGAVGKQNTTVDFLFDDSQDGLGGTSTAVTERIGLINGQQIRSSVNCTSGSGCPSTVVAAGGSGQIATTLTSGPVNIISSTTGNTVAVTASQLFSAAYTSGATGRYANTAGNIVLDDQLFDFGGLHTSEYLVSITIRSQLGAGQTGTTGTSITRTSLSAITVNQVPEPSTVFMALAGLGAVGYFRRRRKA